MTEQFDEKLLDDHIGCFGNFNQQDPICTRLCALSLRCAIEGDQQARIEILEDLVASDGMILKIQ